MKAYDEAMYWKTNPEWYKANYEEEKYELTAQAPPRAIESFRMYLLRNDLPVEERIMSGQK
jgi:hypothetical protein